MTCGSMFFTKMAVVDRRSFRVCWSTGWVCTWGWRVPDKSFALAWLTVFELFSPDQDSFWTTAVRLSSLQTTHLALQEVTGLGALIRGTTAQHSGNNRHFVNSTFGLIASQSPPCFLVLFCFGSSLWSNVTAAAQPESKRLIVLF